jgi:hypothetical protein
MKTEFKVGTFKDYEGKERHYVMAAVSVELKDTDISETSGVIVAIPKALYIGVSVCRATDTFDEKLGKIIAVGKAMKKHDHVLYVTDSGIVNDTVVKAVLAQESAFFEAHPDRYIKGYQHDIDKKELQDAKEKYIEELTDEGRIAYNFLKNSPETDLKLMSLALQVNA